MEAENATAERDQGLVMALLVEQRKRLVAALLQHCENAAWYRHLSEGERQALRQNVLSSVGVFYDLMRDVIKVTRDDSLRNEEALNLLRRVHESQRRMERRLGDHPTPA